MMITQKEQPEINNEQLMDDLTREANYALASKSRHLVYEAYGMAKMAYRLGGITWGQFLELNNHLVVGGLNNPKAGLKY